MADKNIFNAFGWEKSSPVFPWVKDMSLNGGSGAWRPLTASDFSATISGDIGDVVLNTDELEDNTAYQNVPFHETLSISGVAVPITSNASKGWMTLSVDASDTNAQAWIGNSGVVSGNGFLLNSSMPTTTVSSDDLSEWYAYGISGNAKPLYAIGAYLQ